MENLIVCRAVLPEIFRTERNSDKWIGRDTAPHEKLQAALAKRFGGFTSWFSIGGWVDKAGVLIQEEGRTYEVAIDPHAKNAFRDLIAQWGNTYGQECVYVVVDGQANILPTKDRDYSVVRD